MHLKNKSVLLILKVLPLLLAVLIMIPRLTSAQFGLLDDGYIMNEVKAILDGDLNILLGHEAGRFRPVYWLYFTLIYAIAGPNPFWFYIGHLIILLILIVEIQTLMKHQGVNHVHILLTTLVFIFSIPIIENFYTLSKGEPLQLVFILASILCLEKQKAKINHRMSWVLRALTIITLIIAFWTKETAYIMLPLSALWAAYALIQRNRISIEERKAYLHYLGAILIAAVVNVLIFTVLNVSLASGDSYTSQYELDVISILTRAPRWMTLYVHYFSFLLPLAIMVVIIFLNKENENKQLTHNLVFWGSWILAWSIGLMPWQFAESYYLLPFSVGVSILIALLIPHIWDGINSHRPLIHRLMTTMAVICLVLLLASLTHYRTHARVQLTFDRMNDQMINTIRNLLPDDGDLIMGVNTYNEYVQNTGHFLIDQDGMTNITFDFVSLEVLLVLETRSEAILLLPYIEHQPTLLLRAGVEEEFTMAWVDEIQQTLEGRLEPVDQLRAGFQINNINLPVIACPILGRRGFCEHPDPFLDTRLFSYGWDIYRIK